LDSLRDAPSALTVNMDNTSAASMPVDAPATATSERVGAVVADAAAILAASTQASDSIGKRSF
jgi:hypothetical protein